MYLEKILDLWPAFKTSQIESVERATENPIILNAKENWWTRHAMNQPIKGNAGVLVGISNHPDGPQIILTERSAKLNSHSGEVSFPGGRADDADQSIWHTALREAKEEIDLDAEAITAIGQLPSLVSRWGYLVTPCVALIDPNVVLKANQYEVEHVFKVPVEWLLNTDKLSYDEFKREDKPYHPPRWHFESNHKERPIWGLTGMFLQLLLDSAFDSQITNKLDQIIAQQQAAKSFDN